MNRTPQQRARRAALADASSGGHRQGLPDRIPRVRVLLYDCEPTTQVGQPLASHRVFAEARDWTIVAELLDTAPLDRPAMTWPLWPRIAELIDSGQADGIVTSAWDTTDDEISSWLLERQAFVAHISSTSHVPANLPQVG
ncbi:hypothetical protein ACFTTN_13820 [Streptomyces niveus]|uniref:hypothetical protein n=1 Tax=Streptomyces niveus TaxID=193462 RepID=UPI0036291FF7